MGENAHLPQQNGIEKPPQKDPGDQEPPSDHEDSDDLDDMSPEEFQMLDNQLDALNSALDEIEQKNDDIHAQLLVLLQSNREIRRQIRDGNGQGDEPQAQNAN